jgi:hypothetical protein
MGTIAEQVWFKTAEKNGKRMERDFGGRKTAAGLNIFQRGLAFSYKLNLILESAC